MAESVDKIRVRIKIRGRVQGVYYRATALQRAQSLGLTGWVMNCPDGSVQALVEGAPDRVEALVAWCREGPPEARVANVDVQRETPANDFTGFTIRR